MADLITSELDVDMKNSWRTDPEVFNALNKEFNFSLDAAASHDNYLVPNYLTKKEDALSVDWFSACKEITAYTCVAINRSVFINPPYSRGMVEKFMQKSVEESRKGCTVVLLVPATLDAQWLPRNDISEIRIVTGGRLSFYHPINNKKVNGNTKGSMFVIFRPTTMPCVIGMIDRNEFLGKPKKIKAA